MGFVQMELNHEPVKGRREPKWKKAMLVQLHVNPRFQKVQHPNGNSEARLAKYVHQVRSIFLQSFIRSCRFIRRPLEAYPTS